MHKIDDLLKWIELRPCMYIGEYKFENLYHFLNGFLYDNPNLQKPVLLKANLNMNSTNGFVIGQNKI